MPTTQTKAVRYFQPGITRLLWLSAAADYTALTRAELTAGVVLKDLADISGWTITSDTISTPDFDSRFVSTVKSTVSVSDSSLTFYGSRTGDDIRAVLPQDTSGFLVAMDGGDVPDQPMDVFPCDVASLGKVRSISDVFKLQATFNVTSEPSQDQSIPASS